MPGRREWVRFPSQKIYKDLLLRKFHWHDGGRANHVAALMCWVVIAHNADEDSGLARVTYDRFTEATGLGRTRTSAGLKVLRNFGIIANGDKRGHYQLVGYDKLQNWAMLPWRTLYRSDAIAFFHALSGRKVAHLDALKLYLLVAARRDTNTNTANITYDQIGELAGIPRARITDALTLLGSNHVMVVESRPSTQSDFGVHNAYRLRGVDSYRHRGTTMRESL